MGTDLCCRFCSLSLSLVTILTLAMASGYGLWLRVFSVDRGAR